MLQAYLREYQLDPLEQARRDGMYNKNVIFREPSGPGKTTAAMAGTLQFMLPVRYEKEVDAIMSSERELYLTGGTSENKDKSEMLFATVPKLAAM